MTRARCIGTYVGKRLVSCDTCGHTTTAAFAGGRCRRGAVATDHERRREALRSTYRETGDPLRALRAFWADPDPVGLYRATRRDTWGPR